MAVVNQFFPEISIHEAYARLRRIMLCIGSQLSCISIHEAYARLRHSVVTSINGATEISIHEAYARLRPAVRSLFQDWMIFQSTKPTQGFDGKPHSVQGDGRRISIHEAYARLRHGPRSLSITPSHISIHEAYARLRQQTSTIIIPSAPCLLFNITTFERDHQYTFLFFTLLSSNILILSGANPPGKSCSLVVRTVGSFLYIVNLSFFTSLHPYHPAARKNKNTAQDIFPCLSSYVLAGQ